MLKLEADDDLQSESQAPAQLRRRDAMTAVRSSRRAAWGRWSSARLRVQGDGDATARCRRIRSAGRRPAVGEDACGADGGAAKAADASPMQRRIAAEIEAAPARRRREGREEARSSLSGGWRRSERRCGAVR